MRYLPSYRSTMTTSDLLPLALTSSGASTISDFLIMLTVLAVYINISTLLIVCFDSMEYRLLFLFDKGDENM